MLLIEKAKLRAKDFLLRALNLPDRVLLGARPFVDNTLRNRPFGISDNRKDNVVWRLLTDQIADGVEKPSGSAVVAGFWLIRMFALAYDDFNPLMYTPLIKFR